MTDWLRGKDIIGGLLRANLHLAQYVAQVRAHRFVPERTNACNPAQLTVADSCVFLRGQLKFTRACDLTLPVCGTFDNYSAAHR